METSTKEVLESSQIPKLTLQEVLESYNHIRLTDDDITEALIWAKRKKEEENKIVTLRQIEADNRKKKENCFQFDVIRTFMINRAKRLFGDIFKIDKDNENVFNLLCMYHTGNVIFLNLAEKIGVKNPSLDKGILLAGVYGTGKSFMMKLFQQSVRQVYNIRTAKEIAQAYLDSKEKKIPEEYILPFPLASNDDQTFRQPIAGLCIDDIGREAVKNSFGNVSNVIGDLIEERYINKNTGVLLHGTTNLTAKQLNEYYGGAVTSRMREIFNFIELPGEDRRK